MMKVFDDDSWAEVSSDTGWWDISSYADIVGTYLYDPEYNVPLEQATATVRIRRRFDRVQMVADLALPDGVSAPIVSTASVFPDVPSSPLITFGLPLTYAVSDEITIFTRGENSKYSEQERSAEALIVLGRTYTQAEGVGLVLWDRDFYDSYYLSFETRRYSLEWYTQDPFPSQPSGVKIP